MYSSASAPQNDISIHVPRGGDDLPVSGVGDRAGSFQSTSPVGGTTPPQVCHGRSSPISIHVPRGGDDGIVDCVLCEFTNFNPRPPWGGRPYCQGIHKKFLNFNPRPPWGGRLLLALRLVRDFVFQSTSPVGGTTDKSRDTRLNVTNFNPRPPWGGRLLYQFLMEWMFIFQSTSPVGGTTCFLST